MARWVLLRGLGRESAHWFDFKTQLEAVSDDVLALDLPGFGVRNGEKAPITIANTTDKVRDEFLKLKSHHKDWSLMGISLGGMVALDWAARYPLDFQSAAVINTSSKDAGPLWQRLTVFGFYKILQSLTKGRNIREKERAILEMVSNLRNKDEELLDQLTAIAEKRPISIQNISRQLIASSNFMAPSSVKIPLLMLASLKDNMVDSRCTKLLSERLEAVAKYHPDGGHELAMDDAEWVVNQLSEFTESLSAKEVSP